MTITANIVPFEQVFGLDGKPLDNGKIYIGTPNQDPQYNPVQVFWDAAGTIPAAQPIRTVAGYISYNGAPARIYVNGNYSLKVLTKNDVQVYYVPDYLMTGNQDALTPITGIAQFATYAALRAYNGAATVVYVAGRTNDQDGAAGTFAVDESDTTSADNDGTILVDVLGRRWKRQNITHVSPHWWGAKGDGIAVDRPAIQSAIDYIKSQSGGALQFMQSRDYLCDGTLNVIGNFGFVGIDIDLNRSTIRFTNNGNAWKFRPAGVDSADAANGYRQNAKVRNGYLKGPSKIASASVGIYIEQGAGVTCNDLDIDGFYRGYHGYGALICEASRLQIHNCFFGIDLLPTTPVGGYDPQFSPNDIHFYNVQVFDCDRVIRANSFPNGALSFYGCEFEGNNLSGNATDGVNVHEFFNAGKVTFYSCHIEENKGQNNIYFNGANSNCHINFVGCEVIPGDFTGNILYLDNANGISQAGNCTIIGTRATSNSGNIFVAEGFKLTVIGNPLGNIVANLGNVTRLVNGEILAGGAGDTNGKLRVKADSVTNIGAELEGITQIIDATGVRQGYLGNNTAASYFLSDIGHLILGTNAGQRVTVGRGGAKSFEPVEDNTYGCGSASLRWSTIFAGTGSINTSDDREKQYIEISEVEKAVALELKANMRKFKFNDAITEKGAGARIHFGASAQTVKAIFEKHGLNAFDYALLCFDEWEGAEESIDDAGNIIQYKIEAGNIYGIRYEELLSFIISAM